MTFIPGITSTATSGRLFVLAPSAPGVFGPALCVIDGARLPRGTGDGAIFLGEIGGEACFGRVLGPGESAPAGSDPVAVRQLYGVLGDDEFSAAMLALGVTTWDRDHRFCGRCGHPTEPSTKERMRVCTNCKHTAYPRISPAVIALIERDGKALLARNARTQMPFYSTLAGFVEVGESLEQCLRREIREEAGIEITDIKYFGSQSWTFSSSLMVGFTATWASGELHEDPTEIADATWFAPDELPIVPPKLSIARELIDDFARRHGAHRP